MKISRKKVTAAIVMLLTAVLMLTGISYAWFVLSTNPEIRNMDAKITANESLEIALVKEAGESSSAVKERSKQTDTSDPSTAGDPYTWGNYVDVHYAFQDSDGKANGDIWMTPTKYNTETNSLSYPTYDVDGRISGISNFDSVTYVDVKDKTTSAGTNGSKQSVTLYKSNDSETYSAFAVSYWLKSNLETQVSLSQESVARAGNGSSDQTSGAEASQVNGAMGNGSYIQVTADDGGLNSDVLENYLSFMTIRLDVYDDESTTPKDPLYAVIDTSKTSDTAGKYYLTLSSTKKEADDTSFTPTEATIDLERNKAVKIDMFVYLDGENITNEESLLADTDMTINIQFSSSAIEEGSAGAAEGDTSGSSQYTDGKLQ